MSYTEAKKDGIKIVKRELYGYIIDKYVLKCDKCGKEIISNKYERGTAIICTDCKQAIKIEARMAKKNNMDETAKRKLLKMTKFLSPNEIKEYESAFLKIRDMNIISKGFDSSEEMLVAIELTKNKIVFKHHVKTAGYEVDFLLPDEKIILEIDGAIYHNLRHQLDKIRDNNIIHQLGCDYRVVRILDKSINYSVINLMSVISDYLISGYIYDNYIDDNYYVVQNLKNR